MDAHSVDSAGALGYLSLLVLIGSLIVLTVRKPTVAQIKNNLLSGALIGLMQGGAYLLILLAFQRAQAGEVSGLRQVSVIFATLLAREALGRRAVLGSIAVALGAALVIW